MSLNPQIAEILELVKRANRPPLWEYTPQEAREAYRKSSKVLEIPAAKMHKIEDFTIPARDGYALPLRLYEPKLSPEQRAGSSGLPLLLFFHGGGFTIGSIVTHDHVCRMFARDAPCLVISVDYRLAPEAPFPAAVNDAWDALQWVFGHAHELNIDPNRIAIGGDSAGGNLAAVTAIHARDQAAMLNHWTPVLQLLIYPRTSLRTDMPSHIALAEGFLLEAKLIEWFFQQYVTAGMLLDDWRLAPLDGATTTGEILSHAGVAPACIVVAGYDPLHDEGVAYAERLQSAGVKVQLLDYPGLIHGFLNFGGYVPQVREVHQVMADALKIAFSSH